MKQKYFVLLFINFIWLAPVFSQTVIYRNNGILQIEPGTILAIPDQSFGQRLDNYGTIVNEGVIDIPRDQLRNYSSLLNETTGTIIANTINNLENSTDITLGITNKGIIDLRSDFLNNRVNATFSNEGQLFVGRDYKNRGTVTASSTATTTFDRRGVNNTREQRIYVNDGVTNTTSNTFNFNNLVIYNNTKLGVLVKDLVGVIVADDLYLQQGDLRFEGQSQLVQTKSGVDANTAGTGNILRDRSGIASGFGYNYYSSPVAAADGRYALNEVLFDGTDSQVLEDGTNDPVNAFDPRPMNFTTAKDGIPSVLDGFGNVTTAATVSSNYMYAFLKGGIGEYADWKKIDETTELDPTFGFIMKGTNTAAAEQNYTFKGVPNNGEYLYPMLLGESSLLGNPYPSALIADDFILHNFLYSVSPVQFNALYFWTDGGTTEHYSDVLLGGYATRGFELGVPASMIPDVDLGDANLTPPGNYIAVGQGFFVNAVVSGTIEFQNSQRAFYVEDEDPSGSTFYKNSKGQKKVASKDDLSKKQVIRLGHEDPEGFHRQIALAFLPDAPGVDLSFNPLYDVLVNGPREDDLFFIIENDPSKQYVIQGVGLFDENDIFPLSLTIAEEGVHTIMLDAVENFEGDVFIYDTVLDVTYNLKEESFSPSLGIGVYNDRFQLVFKPQKTLSVGEPNERSFNVYFNKENSIIIKNKKSLEIAKISVFNTLGQQVLSLDKEDVQNSETRIPFNKNRGVYLVIVETNNAKETYRIIN